MILCAPITLYNSNEMSKHYRVLLLCRTRFKNNSSPISFGILSEIYRTRLQFRPDLSSCLNKGNRVRVDIRVRLEKMGPDYSETGKHPVPKNTNIIENMEASAAKAERAKRRRQSAIEKQEHEVAEKRRALHDTGN